MERPLQPRYIPYHCYALAHPGDTSTHCMKAARLFPVGWRCDTHRPGAVRVRTTLKEAA